MKPPDGPWVPDWVVMITNTGEGEEVKVERCRDCCKVRHHETHTPGCRWEGYT